MDVSQPNPWEPWPNYSAIIHEWRVLKTGELNEINKCNQELLVGLGWEQLSRISTPYEQHAPNLSVGSREQQHTNLINLKADRNYKVPHMTAAWTMNATKCQACVHNCKELLYHLDCKLASSVLHCPCSTQLTTLIHQSLSTLCQHVVSTLWW